MCVLGSMKIFSKHTEIALILVLISRYQDEVDSIETDEENWNHNECDFDGFDENEIGNNNNSKAITNDRINEDLITDASNHIHHKEMIIQNGNYAICLFLISPMNKKTGFSPIANRNWTLRSTLDLGQLPTPEMRVELKDVLRLSNAFLHAAKNLTTDIIRSL
ncbi:5874_t:CDS:2 [Entrophospora sp. SA101]|nr:5874_t:CDS:2 [Entrophospora sp. SA101]